VEALMDMFSDVPAFVAAVEAGGFAAASRELGLSRSAVGKAVARLEDRLGVRLFRRTTRSQSLTDDGQAFYERCQRALEQLRDGTALMESGHKTASGKLRASMPVLFGRLRIVPLLMRLAGIYPELEFDLSFSDRHVDLVEDGFDLAIRNGPLRDSASLVSRRIARQWTMVYAAPTYIERHGAPQTLEDLANHQAVAYARSGRLHAWQFPREGGTVEERTPPTRLRFDDLGAVADATMAGFGLGWLPDWLVLEQVRSGLLIQVLQSAPSLVTDIYAIWPETPYLPTRVRVTVDAIFEGLSGTAV